MIPRWWYIAGYGLILIGIECVAFSWFDFSGEPFFVRLVIPSLFAAQVLLATSTLKAEGWWPKKSRGTEA